jgi:hypothetical protein
MRARDVRAGRWVKVRAYATGDAADLRELVGQVVAVYQDGSLAAVRFPGRGHIQVQSRWLLHAEAPESSAPQPQSEPDSGMVSKALVAQVARRFAANHDWCDVVDQALRQMGIEPAPSGKFRFVLEIDEDELEISMDEGESMEDHGVAYATLRTRLDEYSSADRSDYLVSVEYVPHKEDK